VSIYVDVSHSWALLTTLLLKQQGTLSFLSHGASGIFGYASKVAAAAGQGIASISLDNEFRDWHNDTVVVGATNLNREWKRRGVQNVGYIIAKPITDIILGFAGGITGVVILPIKGFQKNGSTGFIVGMGAGVIGIFAKPMVSEVSQMCRFIVVKAFSNLETFVIRSDY
jgi:hypothetical protein